MEKTLIATGKSIDLAVEAALAQLGLSRDDVSVQVLQQAKAGFLGFGAQPAKVQVTYEVPDPVVVPEKPKSALGSASRSNKAKVNNPAPAPEKKPEPAKTEKKPEAPKAEPKKEQPKAERKPRPEKKVEAVKAEPKVYATAEAGSVEEQIEVFLKGLLEQMDSNAVPHCVKGEDNTYKVELVGDDLGYLIGRRGDTLDAIQHLANYSVGRFV